MQRLNLCLFSVAFWKDRHGSALSLDLPLSFAIMRKPPQRLSSCAMWAQAGVRDLHLEHHVMT